MQSPKRALKPAQQQRRRPGLESAMRPQPRSDRESHRGSGKLEGKVAIITGGDSGIGRAIAIAFAKEGADVAISYLNEHEDATETCRLVIAHKRRSISIPGDIGSEAHCVKLIKQVTRKLGGLNILVNNAAEQHPQKSITDITAKQLDRTFRTNIFAMFFLVKAALKYLKADSASSTRLRSLPIESCVFPALTRLPWPSRSRPRGRGRSILSLLRAPVRFLKATNGAGRTFTAREANRYLGGAYEATFDDLPMRP